MRDLQAIARSKTDADLNRQLSDLPVQVRALQQQLAAKGSLKSGNMLRGVLKLAQQSVEAQGASVATHYTWALQQALTASQAWVQLLAAEGASSLAPLLARASGLITDACQIADQPNLAPKLLGDLETTHLQVKESIRTALEAGYATKSRGFLRRLGGVVGRLIKLGGTGT